MYSKSLHEYVMSLSIVNCLDSLTVKGREILKFRASNIPPIPHSIDFLNDPFWLLVMFQVVETSPHKASTNDNQYTVLKEL